MNIELKNQIKTKIILLYTDFEGLNKNKVC